MAHKNAVMDVSFSPKGNLMASASRDRTIRLWVPSIQGETADIKAHSGVVRSVEFSPDGSQLLTASDDKSIKLWMVARRKFVCSFLGHNHWVRCARFSPNNHLIASCSDDKTIRLFDQTSGKSVHTFNEIQGKICAQYTLCNTFNAYLLTCYNVCMVNILWFGLLDNAVNVAFHPSGMYIGAAMINGAMKLYDLRTHNLLQCYKGHTGTVHKIAFHPCQNYVLTASQDSTMKVSFK